MSLTTEECFDSHRVSFYLNQSKALRRWPWASDLKYLESWHKLSVSRRQPEMFYWHSLKTKVSRTKARLRQLVEFWAAMKMPAGPGLLTGLIDLYLPWIVNIERPRLTVSYKDKTKYWIIPVSSIDRHNDRAEVKISQPTSVLTPHKWHEDGN